MNKVVSLGIHIVDVLGRPVTNVPAGQGLALIDEIRFTVAGTAAGASVDMAKLGLDVRAMGAIGQDEIGDFLVATMRGYGINTSHLVRKPNMQTSCTMLPIRPNGERPALHVIGANGELTYDDINLEAIASANFLHVGGTPLMAKFDGAPASRVLRFAKEKGLTTTFDLLGVPKPNLKELVEVCLPYLDFFMVNDDEAAMISGIQDPKEAVRYFCDLGARHAVIRLGANGSLIGYLESGSLKEIYTPAFEVPVVDSTGCGDSYTAGLIKGLSLGWDLEKSAWLGSACGGLVIQGLGSDAGIVDFESTVRFAQTATPKKSCR
jgi:sugar/nucleoside kinase (ribokinase family)